MRPRHLSAGAAFGAGAFLVAAFGCSTKVVAPPVDEPPAANSATGAVARFAWGFNHRNPEVVRGLLTDDFLFVRTGIDSAGNPSGTPNDRSGFVAALPAFEDSSSTVRFVIDQALVLLPDSRPGRAPSWHKQVRTWVRVETHGAGNTSVDLMEHALFFVTRGDSASIPQELRDRGVIPDSTWWWLDRFEYGTLPSGSVR